MHVHKKMWKKVLYLFKKNSSDECRQVHSPREVQKVDKFCRKKHVHFKSARKH